MKLIIILYFLFGFCYGMNVIDNPELLYQMPVGESWVYAQKVTVNWKFNSFNDFIIALQKNYQINTRIMSTAAKPKSAILIYLNNGTLSELITKTSIKFGYTWSYKDGMFIFNALNPIAASAGKLPEQSAWSMGPIDKTLKAVLFKWCKIADWQLIWNAYADYPITTTWKIYGNFETAVNEVLKATQDTDVPLRAIMHDSNHVLEISSPTTNIK